MKKGQKKQVFDVLHRLGQRLSELANSKTLFAGNTNVSETTPVELTTQGQDVLERIITIIKQHQNLSLSAGGFKLTEMSNAVGISNSALLDIHRQIRSIKEALKKPFRKGKRLRVQFGSIDPYSVDIRIGSVTDIFTKG